MTNVLRFVFDIRVHHEVVHNRTPPLAGPRTRVMPIVTDAV